MGDTRVLGTIGDPMGRNFGSMCDNGGPELLVKLRTQPYGSTSEKLLRLTREELLMVSHLVFNCLSWPKDTP